MGLNGKLRWANRAAHTAFPDLLERGSSTHHPAWRARASRQRADGGRGAPALHEQGGHPWELTVVLLPDSENLRVFAKDLRRRLARTNLQGGAGPHHRSASLALAV